MAVPSDASHQQEHITKEKRRVELFKKSISVWERVGALTDVRGPWPKYPRPFREMGPSEWLDNVNPMLLSPSKQDNYLRFEGFGYKFQLERNPGPARFRKDFLKKLVSEGLPDPDSGSGPFFQGTMKGKGGVCFGAEDPETSSSPEDDFTVEEDACFKVFAKRIAVLIGNSTLEQDVIEKGIRNYMITDSIFSRDQVIFGDGNKRRTNAEILPYILMVLEVKGQVFEAACRDESGSAFANKATTPEAFSIKVQMLFGYAACWLHNQFDSSIKIADFGNILDVHSAHLAGLIYDALKLEPVEIEKKLLEIMSSNLDAKHASDQSASPPRGAIWTLFSNNLDQIVVNFGVVYQTVKDFPEFDEFAHRGPVKDLGRQDGEKIGAVWNMGEFAIPYVVVAEILRDHALCNKLGDSSKDDLFPKEFHDIIEQGTHGVTDSRINHNNALWKKFSMSCKSLRDIILSSRPDQAGHADVNKRQDLAAKLLLSPVGDCQSARLLYQTLLSRSSEMWFREYMSDQNSGWTQVRSKIISHLKEEEVNLFMRDMDDGAKYLRIDPHKAKLLYRKAKGTSGDTMAKASVLQHLYNEGEANKLYKAIELIHRNDVEREQDLAIVVGDIEFCVYDGYSIALNDTDFNWLNEILFYEDNNSVRVIGKEDSYVVSRALLRQCNYDTDHPDYQIITKGYYKDGKV